MRQVLAGFVIMLPLAGVFTTSKRISASPGEAAADRTLSTVSLNMAKETDADKVVRAIREVPRLRDADVYLLQEVSHREGEPSVAEEAARKLGYSSCFQPASPGVYDQGLAIISRYPISNVEIKRLKVCDLRFRSRNRFAIRAGVQTPWGDVRIWNVHLDTRINQQERLDQLQPVIDDAAGHTGPRLIGGDFNTNDLYWLGNVLPLPLGPTHGASIRHAMRRHGFESPLPTGLDTYPLFGRHLDWIYLNELQPVAASVEPAAFSDHHAIWVRVRVPLLAAEGKILR